MTLKEWSRMVEAAVSPGEIAHIAVAYLSQLSEADRQSLPARCRAALVMDAADVSACAERFEALECQLAASASCSSVTAMSSAGFVFSAASRRLATLSSDRPRRFRSDARLASPFSS